MSEHWIAQRTQCFDSSGIRKMFDLGAKMTDPINLSIGQPDFDVPEPAKQAAIDAIRSGKNGYALSQGMPVLREKLQARIDRQYGHDDREVFVTSGSSGALVLAMLARLDPGDEVIVFDPYFVIYNAMAGLVGGRVVYVDTYPDFRIDLDRVAEVQLRDRPRLLRGDFGGYLLRHAPRRRLLSAHTERQHQQNYPQPDRPDSSHPEFLRYFVRHQPYY